MFMRAAIENWLLRHWYGEHRPPWYLRALEPVYRAIFRYVQRKGASSTTPACKRLPLIVVGNITAGGSGKTPLVMHLCRLAEEMQFRPGIASTGYGRRASDARVVQPQSDTRICGDEPVLLAKRTGAPVVVARRRAEAIGRLEEMGLDLVISDDGLQQAGLRPDIALCVIDGARGVGNGHLIPAGPLREPADRLERVDFIVTTGIWGRKPEGLGSFVMQLTPGNVHSLDDQTVFSVKEFRQKYSGKIIHTFVAIGNPQRFLGTLGELGIKTTPHVFPDHHMFELEDFDSIPPGQAIIMTEKDAVKCRSMRLENAWYLPVDTFLPEAFENSFKEKLMQLMETRK